jgi:pilus assembly protein Flp/PilA
MLCLSQRDFRVWRSYAKTTEALKRLRADHDAVVSFEYVIVAAVIVGAVAAAFSNGSTGPIKDALTSALSAIVKAVTTAAGG